MRKPSLIGPLLLSVALLLVACSPRAVPAPAPSSQEPMPRPAAPVSPVVSAQDTEWQQVVKAAQREGKLVVYDCCFFSGDRRTVVPQVFKDKYGINVEILVTGGSSVTIEKMQVEQKVGVSVGDVFSTGSISGPRMISLGLTREIAGQLPVLKDKSPFVMDPVFSPGGEAVIFGYTMIGAAANTKQVQPAEVQSYRDLMKPKFKGKIVIRDPRLGSGTLSLYTMRHLRLLDDEFFRNLVQQQGMVMWGGGTFEGAQMLARGEFMVNLELDYNNLAQLVQGGAPVTLMHMQEGTVGMPLLILESKTAPHPNAARLFMNWLLTQEGQTVYHKAGSTPPLRKDVPDFLPAEMKKEPIKKLLPTNWEVTQAMLKMIEEKYAEKVWGKR